MSVVSLPSQKLKSCQKLRLEGKIGKWPEAYRVAAPHINARLVVAAAASLSVSLAKRFFARCKHCNENNRAIAGDSATGQKKLTARQWAELIGFCGVETRKQVPKFGSK